MQLADISARRAARKVKDPSSEEALGASKCAGVVSEIWKAEFTRTVELAMQVSWYSRRK